MRTTFTSSLYRIQRSQIARVDDHVVADEADMGTAFDHTIGNHTACNVDDFGNGDDLMDFDRPGNLFFLFRGKHTTHSRFNVVDGIEEDVAGADFEVFIFGKAARRGTCTNV